MISADSRKEVFNQTPLEKVLTRLSGVVKTGASTFQAKCPAHDDGTASLTVSVGEKQPVVLYCHAGCREITILHSIGLIYHDICKHEPKTKQSRIVAEYNYTDEAGETLYQVVRLHPKTFRQRRPSHNGNRWSWELGEVRRVLYNLPLLLSSDSKVPVFVCEGEKDADNLTALELVATTNVSGSSKWRDEYSESLAGRIVVILPDNDEPGRKHAHAVARSLTGKAKSVKILTLSGLPLKGDVSNWIESGGTKERLLQLAESTPEVDVATLSEAKTQKGNDPSHPIGGNGATVDDPARLAERFLYGINYAFREPAELSDWVHHKGEWLRYNGRHYEAVIDSEIRADIGDVLDMEFTLDYRTRAEQGESGPRIHITRTRVNDTVANAERLAASRVGDLPAWRGNPEWLKEGKGLPDPRECIIVENGILDVAKMIKENIERDEEQVSLHGDFLLPHTKMLLSRNSLPFAFDPDAKANEFAGELFEMVDEGDAEVSNNRCELIQQFMGLLLVPDMRFHRALVVHGVAGSGKSSALAAMQSLLGPRNYSSIPLSRLNDRFAMAPLIAKLANFSSDERRIDGMDSGILKSAISGDSLTIEIKHREAYVGPLTARFVVASNHFPMISDTSNGTTRRLLPVKCVRELKPGEMKVGRDNPSWWLESGRCPGLLAFALKGLIDLRRKGGFRLHPRILDEMQEYKLDANPTAKFLDECCEIKLEHEVGTKQLYDKYRSWMIDNGLHAKGQPGFGRDLAELVSSLGKDKNRGIYKGIRIRIGI